MTKALLLIVIIGFVEGCSHRTDVCTIELLSPTEFLVEGERCATNSLPSRKAMELGKSVVRVVVRDPSKFQVYGFVHFMWDVVNYSEGVLALSDGGELHFGVGPDYPKIPQTPRIAFTSTKVHCRCGEGVMSCPVEKLNEVCGMIMKSGDGGKDAAIEFGFQGDRVMTDVIEYMKVANETGFKSVRVCYYSGKIDDDKYDFTDL